MGRSSRAEMKLCAATDAYLKNCAATDFSPRTLKNYTYTLEDFMNFFIESKENYADPSYATILLWRDSLIERQCSPATVRQYLIRLHAFFEFACDPQCGGWYQTNPVSKRLLPNTLAKRPPPPRQGRDVSPQLRHRDPASHHGAA